MNLKMVEMVWNVIGYAHDGIKFLVDSYAEPKEAERKAKLEMENWESIRSWKSAESNRWITWRNSLPGAANPEIDVARALSYAGLVKRSLIVSDLISKVQDLPKPTRSEAVELTINYGPPECIALFAHLVTLWAKHNLWNLPPHIQLANIIGYRNGLVQLGFSSATTIENLDTEIGRLAHAYSSSWLTG